MYGALVREKMKSGKLTGKCLTAVYGSAAVEWVKQQAEEQEVTEARICRDLLNEAIQRKMATKKK